MEQFSEEYIKEVRDIIKNNDTEKAKELLGNILSHKNHLPSLSYIVTNEEAIMGQ